ncbi:MAG: hypothetical protein FWD35_05770 [Oscillospiraceae bacterium]|nr:hypothetical protein [Oscillospiraceae bacterium]
MAAKKSIISAALALILITASVFLEPVPNPLTAFAPQDPESPPKRVKAAVINPEGFDPNPGDTERFLNVPPVVRAVPVLLFAGEQIESCAFYKVPAENADDHVGLTSEYLPAAAGAGGTTPDWGYIGTQAVHIRVRDAYDSYTYIESELTIAVDTTAPLITGARDLTVLVGTTVAFRSGITVTDDLDPDPRLQVDSSAVDLQQIATYPLIYTATDRAGNSSRVEVRVHVVNISLGDLHKLADERLQRLRVFDTDDMTERARLIYRYVLFNMEYVRAIGPGGQSDEYFAYSTLRTMRGNCIASQRASEILLERAGVTNMRIQNTDSTHVWNLVFLDDEWYHYDATWYNDCRFREAHKFTTEKAYELSPNRNNRYHFDESLYPPIRQS